MSDAVADVAFEEISRRLHATRLPETDVVVAIGLGGLIPAAMVAHQLSRPMRWCRVQWRQPGSHRPMYERPRVVQELSPLPPGALRVLLVDDVSVTGATLELARALLPAGVLVTTLVLKGRADVVLFPELRTCVRWPWPVAASLGEEAPTHAAGAVGAAATTPADAHATGCSPRPGMT